MKFKVKSKLDFDICGEEFIPEHKQVRDVLKDKGQSKISQRLFNLSQLREVADYFPDKLLADDDLNKAMGLMEYIFKNIKFDG